MKTKHRCLVRPWGKGVPHFKNKKKVIVMACDVLNEIFCANVSQPTMIPKKKINYKALK